MSFSRHDVHPEARKVVDEAVRVRVIDALGMVELMDELAEKGLKAGDEVSKALVKELVSYAFASRHCSHGDENPHSAVAKAADGFWFQFYGNK